MLNPTFKCRNLIKKTILVSMLIFFTMVLYGCNRNTLVKDILNNQEIIAHAGGGLDEMTYLNVQDSIAEHYALGTRLFEYDFAFSSDDYLIGIHYWESYLIGEGYSFENRMSLADYENTLIAGEYVGITFSNLLKLMNDEYQDIVIIMDTKEADMEKFYEAVVAEATAINIDLLERVVPQIYNEEMYDVLEAIYSFDSYVYTLYKTNATNEEVYDFIAKHKKIRILTVSTSRVNFMIEEEGYIDSVHKLNRKIFVHTINDFDLINYYKDSEIDGFYSDFITQSDMENLKATSKE